MKQVALVLILVLACSVVPATAGDNWLPKVLVGAVLLDAIAHPQHYRGGGGYCPPLRYYSPPPPPYYGGYGYRAPISGNIPWDVYPSYSTGYSGCDSGRRIVGWNITTYTRYVNGVPVGRRVVRTPVYR